MLEQPRLRSRSMTFARQSPDQVVAELCMLGCILSSDPVDRAVERHGVMLKSWLAFSRLTAAVNPDVAVL
jgi:hypothetical protein